MNQQGFTNKNNFIGDVQVSQDLTVGDDLIIEGDIDVNDVVTNSIETNELNPKPPATKVNMGGDLDMVNQDILNCNNIALLSINGTSETDYFLKDGSRLMTGNLNINGNDIRFVTQISGTNFNYIGLENTTGNNTIESNAPLLIRRAGTNITVNPADTTFSKDINMSSNDILNCDNINATTVNGSSPLTFTGTPPTVVDELVLYNSVDGSQIKESGIQEANLFLADGTRAMTGDLDMGNTNDIKNAQQIYGPSFSYIGFENSSGNNTIESNAPLLIRRAGTNITVRDFDTQFNKDIDMDSNNIVLANAINSEFVAALQYLETPAINSAGGILFSPNGVGPSYEMTSDSIDCIFNNIKNIGDLVLADGALTNSVTISAAAVSAAYPLILPAAQSVGTQFLENDGSGNLSWATAGGTIDVESTGVLTGGVLSIGAPNTTFSITDGTGVIIVSDPLTPTATTKTPVSWTGKTNIAVTNIATQLITFVSIDNLGNVLQESSRPSNALRRSQVFLGVIVHVNNVSVDAVNNQQDFSVSPLSQLRDLTNAIGFINVTGNVVSQSGSLLRIQKTEGTMYANGSNYINDPQNPNLITLPALDTNVADLFQYRLSDGTNIVPNTADINPNGYDDGTSILAPVPVNDWTIQRVYSFTSNNLKLQFGQTVYQNEAAALDGLLLDPFVTEPSIAANGMLIAYIVVQQGETNLANATFISAGKFGEGGAGGGGGGGGGDFLADGSIPMTGDLQMGTNSVITPQITSGLFDLNLDSGLVGSIDIERTNLGSNLQTISFDDGTRPAAQLYHFDGDDLAYYLGCYKDLITTNIISSDAGSNYAIQKTGDEFRVSYGSGVAAGSVASLTAAFTMDSAGEIIMSNDTECQSNLTVGLDLTINGSITAYNGAQVSTGYIPTTSIRALSNAAINVGDCLIASGVVDFRVVPMSTVLSDSTPVIGVALTSTTGAGQEVIVGQARLMLMTSDSVATIGNGDLIEKSGITDGRVTDALASTGTIGASAQAVGANTSVAVWVKMSETF